MADITTEQDDTTTLLGAAARMQTLRLTVPEETEELPEEATETAAPEETEADEAEEFEAGDDADDFEAEELHTLDPPAAWTADAKERFHTLDPEVQQEIVRRDRDMEIGARQKVEEAANARKEAEAEAERARQAREAYAERLAQAVTAAGDLQPPDIELLNEHGEAYDPDEYHRQNHLFNQKKAASEQNVAEFQKLQQEQAAEREQKMREFRAQQGKVLLERFPTWSDDEKANDSLKEIRDYIAGPQYGIPKETAAQIVDANMLTIAWKAMQYDKRKSPKPKAPTVARPTARARANPAPKSETILKKHKQDGTVDTATAALRALRKG